MKKILFVLCFLISRAFAQCDTTTSITATGLSPYSEQITWNAVSGATSYAWSLYCQTGCGGTAVQSGTTAGTTITLSSLTPAFNYQFIVTTICAGPTTSSPKSKNFTTLQVQITYTPMTAAGYQYKYVKVDSGLAVPVVDTTTGRGTTRPGSIVCRTADSLFYGWNGRYWAVMGADVASLVAKINTKVDSVIVSNDTLFYWVNGVSHGQVFDIVTADQLHDSLTNYITSAVISNDSLYQVRQGVYEFVGMVGASGGGAWSTTGNSGLNSSTNFIGTTDDVDLVFKRNNESGGFIGSPASGNTAFGVEALSNVVGGDGSTAMGHGALVGMVDGSSNTAFGESALGSIIDGDHNTGIGLQAGVDATNARNRTAIGANAYVTQNNSLVLGSISGINGGYANTKVGIGTTAPDSSLHVVGGLKFPSLYRSNNSSDSMLVIKSNGGVGYRSIPTGNPGTVTSVGTGYGLSGGTITSSGTLLIDSATLSNKYIRIGDTANYFAPYRTKIQLNTDSITAHNTRIGKNNDSLIAHNTRIGAVTTSVGAKQDTATAWQTSGNYNSGLRYLGSRTRQGIGLITSDSVRVYLDSLGRVGIGNTPQTTSQRLYVEGTPTTYLQGVAKFRSNFSASSTNPAYAVLIGGQNTTNNTLLLGVDGFGNALIAGNNTSFFRLGRDNGSGTFTSIIDIQSGGAIINNSAGNNITSSAVFEIVSTTKGLLIPVQTQTQVNAVSSPANGLQVYNTDSNKVQIYGNGRWNYIPKGLIATATLDFSSTSAQSSADLTITVTGAVDGDMVMLGVPNGSTLTNSAYTAWVSAANTVTVRFSNYSSGSQDPASGTFKVMVIK